MNSQTNAITGKHFVGFVCFVGSVSLFFGMSQYLLDWRLGPVSAATPPATATAKIANPVVLSIAERDLQLGDIPADKPFSRKVLVTNISGQRVVVNDLEPSCHCTSVSPQAFTLDAGESLELTLTIDLSHSQRRSRELEAEEGESFMVDIYPQVATANARTLRDSVWTFNGRIHRDISKNSIN